MRLKESKKVSIKGKSAFIFWVAVSCLYLIGSPSFAAAPVNGEALPGLESFDKVMIKFIGKHDIPGGALAVSFKGRLMLAKGYGYADFSVLKKFLPILRIDSVSPAYRNLSRQPLLCPLSRKENYPSIQKSFLCSWETLLKR